MAVQQPPSWLMCPCFVTNTNNTVNTDAVNFYKFYLVVDFVRLDEKQDDEVLIPAINVQSILHTIVNADENIQVPVKPETYKIVAGVQTSGTTLATGGPNLTRFCSGTAATAITNMSAQSALLQQLQVKYAGQSIPNQPYDLGLNKYHEAFTDFIGGTDGVFDPSGSESVAQWIDPVAAASVGQGRMFCFNVVKSSKDQDSNAELTVKFTSTPATSRLYIAGINKLVFKVKYNAFRQIESVESVSFM